MNLIPSQSFETWKGVLCGLYSFAIASSIPGLIHEFRASRSSVRDWARRLEPYLSVLVSCLGIVAAGVLSFLYLEKDSHKHIDAQKGMYYLMSVSWISIIWLTRIRMALNLSRCTKTPVRPIALGLVLSSSVLYAGHILWMSAVGCTHKARVLPDVSTSAHCNANKEGLDVIGLIVNCVTEIALIGVSVYALIASKRTGPSSTDGAQWAVEEDSSPRNIAIGAVLMLLFTITHCAFRYSPLVVGIDGVLVKDMSMQMEAVVSIFASNLPALIAWYVWIRRPSASSCTKSRPTSMSSTSFSHSRDSSFASRDVKVPTAVITLAELSPSKREHDRKLGLDRDDRSDTSSVRSHRSSSSIKVGEFMAV